MLHARLWAAVVTAAALLLTGLSAAQPPGEKGGPPPKKGKGDGFRKGAKSNNEDSTSIQAVVERIMAYDKAKTGTITKDALPERMQAMVADGDTNKDGVLDRDEVLALVTKRASQKGGGRFGKGPPGKGGFKKGPPE